MVSIKQHTKWSALPEIDHQGGADNSPLLGGAHHVRLRLGHALHVGVFRSEPPALAARLQPAGRHPQQILQKWGGPSSSLFHHQGLIFIIITTAACQESPFWGDVRLGRRICENVKG